MLLSIYLVYVQGTEPEMTYAILCKIQKCERRMCTQVYKNEHSMSMRQFAY
jgi:hypothetical protein